MPFSIQIRRSRAGEHSEPQAAVPLEQLEQLMEEGPVERREGNRWYLHRLKGRHPWLVVDWSDQAVELQFSLGNALYLDNIADGLRLSLRMAEALEGEVQIQGWPQLLSAEELEKVLVPHGAWLQEQLLSWRRQRKILEQKGLSPIEYPVHGQDGVPEFLCFYLKGEDEIEPRALRNALERACAWSQLKAYGERAFVIRDPETQLGRVKILLKPNGDIQVWPCYWPGPFHEAASQTLRVAEDLRAELSWELFYYRQPVDHQLLQSLLKETRKTGYHFWLWYQQR